MPEDDPMPEIAPERSPRDWRRGALLGVRLTAGVVSLAAAAAVVGAVGLVPLPTLGAVPDGIAVTPAPAEQLRVCAGPALRLGDEQGNDASVPTPVGSPRVTATALVGGETSTAESAPLPSPASPGAAPELLRLAPGADSYLAGAQGQSPSARGFGGYLASACLEPGASSWLVGGSTTVGRTSLLSLVNPSEVEASVDLEILSESGPVSAPGMDGIAVPAGGERVLSLAAFAPGLASPVVHVTARGGAIVATLQQTVVRGLDDGGTELVSPGAAPAERVVVPGVRLSAQASTAALQGLEGWDDVVAVVRLAVPGDQAGRVRVAIASDVAGQDATSFEVSVDAGRVVDLPLDSGFAAESGLALADGDYTVTVDADVPVLAAVRASTSGDQPAAPGPATGDDSPAFAAGEAPESDLAWFASAEPLTDTTVVAVADGPSPVLTLANGGDAVARITIDELGGPERTVEVAPGAFLATSVLPGRGYRLAGAADVVAGVSFAAEGRLSGYPLVPVRPAAPPVLIRP